MPRIIHEHITRKRNVWEGYFDLSDGERIEFTIRKRIGSFTNKPAISVMQRLHELEAQFYD